MFLGAGGAGYLIASAQGRDAFNVYRREGRNEYVATFAIEDGNGIDRVTKSDGVDVLNASLGPRFPDGVFVTQDHQTRQQAELQARAVAGNRSGHPENVRRATDLVVDGGGGAQRCDSIKEVSEGSHVEREPSGRVRSWLAGPDAVPTV